MPSYYNLACGKSYCVKAKQEIGAWADGAIFAMLLNIDVGWNRERDERRKAMKAEVLAQVKEMLREVTNEGEIAEISGIIEEAKGKLRLAERDMGFWESKTPCWEMFRCPAEVRSECPAHTYRSTPCWQIEGTYCKLAENGMRGDGTEICESCRVYKKWGHAEPIQITLQGKGFNPVGKIVGEQKERMKVETKIRTETLRLGDMVRIKECEARQELVGARGQIVQMQTQQYEEYCIRPIWVKITSGEGQGRTCGFWERELEIVSVA
jgi:protein-arginine kinase activator protein McsA